jgi:hypothetical protein
VVQLVKKGLGMHDAVSVALLLLLLLLLLLRVACVPSCLVCCLQ